MEQKKVLHVGCGPSDQGVTLHKSFRGPEWLEVRLDINENVKPDIVGDIRHMPAVETGSMDAVYSSHNIEHLFPHEVPLAFGEFARVLKEGGQLLIATPDMQRVAEKVAQGLLEEPLYISPAGPISAIDMMYGFRPSIAAGNHYMAHKTAFTFRSLATYLLRAGFVDVQIFRESYNLWGHATKRANTTEQERITFNMKDLGAPSPPPQAAA